MTQNWQTTITPEWEQTQNTLQPHILQTTPWATFQTALGRTTLYAHSKTWSWLAILEKSRLGTRLYCPYGPTATTPKALQAALDALTQCAQAHNCTYIRIEPQGPFNASTLKKLSLKPAHRNIQPHYTWAKDLTPTQDQLLSEMTSTNRNLYRTAHKKGLTFRTTTNPADIDIFLSMMHEVAGKNAITIHADNYYRTMANTLMPLGALKYYIAEHDGQPVATSLVLDSPTTRYYAHAASHFSARKLHPGTPLLANMIFDAKKQGQTTFDFYGIAPPDQPNHPWAGFTKFKQSFGGHIVDLGGTWEKPIKPLPYATYRLLTKLKK